MRLPHVSSLVTTLNYVLTADGPMKILPVIENQMVAILFKSFVYLKKIYLFCMQLYLKHIIESYKALKILSFDTQIVLFYPKNFLIFHLL